MFRLLRELPDHVKGKVKTSQEELQLLLLKNAPKSSDDLGQTDMVRPKVGTGDLTPIRQPPQRLPLAQKEEADEPVRDMSSQGLSHLNVHGPPQLFLFRRTEA